MNDNCVEKNKAALGPEVRLDAMHIQPHASARYAMHRCRSHVHIHAQESHVLC